MLERSDSTPDNNVACEIRVEEARGKRREENGVLREFVPDWTSGICSCTRGAEDCPYKYIDGFDKQQV